ncbi:MAG TPA: (5-formylfuran-3-yl)methyl phosphate synthase, partial [Planctomycetota bacterium]|nr:(5-formylfuran-3-yl)methyl phosphate synthase [Planctomycetota bacterium]
ERLGDDALCALIKEAHEAGVRIALAGSLGAADIESLTPLGPDVLAVRGAACLRGKRDLEVDARRVAALVARIEAGSKEAFRG